MMSLEERLKEYAKKIGIDLLGITTAEPFPEALERLEKMHQLGYLSPWAEQDLEKRCNPRMLMEDAESIIAVAISYLQPEQKFNGGGSGEGEELVLRGKLARFAHFQDYHQLLEEKMGELVEFLKQCYPNLKAQIYVDTGPLIDREIAYRAGLGFIGKNATLIHPQYGSFLALGEILVNITLQPDHPLEEGCGECSICMKSCPQQVIQAPGEIQTRECLAHYTQEKGLLTEEIRRKLGQRLWGCDTCQEVCPYNRIACSGKGDLFKVHSLGTEPDLAQILGLSNREYKTLIGNTAMAWRGKRTLQRNAMINLGNLQNPQGIPVLQEALNDQRPVIRGIAAWALSEIGGEEVKGLLENAFKVETDDTIKHEIEKGIDRVIKKL